MKHDCIQKAQQNIVKKATFKNKKITDAVITDVALLMPKLLAQTHSEVQVRLEGSEKTHKTTLLHTFCPFCGKKYEDLFNNNKTTAL